MAVFGLPATVVAFVVTVGVSAVGYLISRRFAVLQTGGSALLQPGDAVFLASIGLGVFLGLEINGRGVITQGLVNGLSVAWPLAQYVGIGLALWYLYKRFIAGPDVETVPADEATGSSSSGSDGAATNTDGS